MAEIEWLFRCLHGLLSNALPRPLRHVGDVPTRRQRMMNQLARPIVPHFIRRPQHGMPVSQFFYRCPKHLFVKIRWNSDEHRHIRGGALGLQLMKQPERKLVMREGMKLGILSDCVRVFRGCEHRRSFHD